ncbi:MAG: hypothetical protein EG825_14910, partial [Rhodocyclaceae bacterium]|nr:hypothetical protein [Rhodocyclaceae bacterium]
MGVNRWAHGGARWSIVSFAWLTCIACVQAGPMATSGQFEVSPSGAATYTLPIPVPPGTGGIEPKLALSYNSQSGNGLLGVGWSLSGLSAIGRCPQTLAQDNVRGSINYDANDRYCLDGQRLILVSGTYGADGAEYRTERESFSRIISYGTAGNGPASFKVWTKAGQLLEYGNTADSRIEAVKVTGSVATWPAGTVRVWALNKLSDTKGNYLTVTYTEDATNGDFTPSRIDYTGNAGAGLTPNNSVLFVYETRTDAIAAYVAGSMIKPIKRLKTIQSQQAGVLTHELRLAFDNLGAVGTSRLTSVEQCDGAATCMPKVTFEWQSGSDGTVGAKVKSGDG